MRLNILLTLLSLMILSLSCSHTNPEQHFLERYSSNKSEVCMKPLESLEKGTPYKIFDHSKQALGTGVSYIATGFSYTTDFILAVSTGLGVGVILCSPLITAEAAMKSNFNASGHCISSVGGSVHELFPKELGKATYHGTEKLRCPEVDHISKALREVATCYHTNKQIQKAKEQLVLLQEDDILRRCRSKKENKEVETLVRSYVL